MSTQEDFRLERQWERELRKACHSFGLNVQRYKSKNVGNPLYGTYQLVFRKTELIVRGPGDERAPGYGLTLDDIAIYLKNNHSIVCPRPVGLKRTSAEHRMFMYREGPGGIVALVTCDTVCVSFRRPDMN